MAVQMPPNVLIINYVNIYIYNMLAHVYLGILLITLLGGLANGQA